MLAFQSTIDTISYSIKSFSKSLSRPKSQKHYYWWHLWTVPQKGVLQSRHTGLVWHGCPMWLPIYPRLLLRKTGHVPRGDGHHIWAVIDLLPTKIILHCLSSESRKHLTLGMEIETEDKGVRINHCLHAVKCWSVSPLASCSDHIGTITTILLHSSSPVARGEGVKVWWGWMLYAGIVVSTCWCMASVCAVTSLLSAPLSPPVSACAGEYQGSV